MVTTDHRSVRNELLQWAEIQSHPLKIRCDIIAISLGRLAEDPTNLALRRETMVHVLNLSEALSRSLIREFGRQENPQIPSF